MLKLKLLRLSKNYYKIVVINHCKSAKSRDYFETLGFYQIFLNKTKIVLNKKQFLFWLKRGLIIDSLKLKKLLLQVKFNEI